MRWIISRVPRRVAAGTWEQRSESSVKCSQDDSRWEIARRLQPPKSFVKESSGKVCSGNPAAMKETLKRSWWAWTSFRQEFNSPCIRTSRPCFRIVDDDEVQDLKVWLKTLDSSLKRFPNGKLNFWLTNDSEFSTFESFNSKFFS